MEKNDNTKLNYSHILNFGWFTKVYSAIDMWYGSKRNDVDEAINMSIRSFCESCDYTFSLMAKKMAEKESYDGFNEKCVLICSFIFRLSWVDRARLGFDLYADENSFSQLKRDLKRYVDRIISICNKRYYEIGSYNAIIDKEDESLTMCGLFKKIDFEFKVGNNNLSPERLRFFIKFRYKIDGVIFAADERLKELVLIPVQETKQIDYESINGMLKFFIALERFVIDMLSFKQRMEFMSSYKISVSPLEYVDYLVKGGYNIVSLEESDKLSLLLEEYKEHFKSAKAMIRLSNAYMSFLKNINGFSKNRFHEMDKVNKVLLQKNKS